jgi:formylmethanofuran dehydrogenase subunit A
MVLKLKGGRLYDPAQGVNGEVRDIHVRDGRVIERPERGERIEREYDLAGRVVMAGAIDIHTHIGGGKVNLARAMLPEDHRNDPVLHTELSRASSGRAAPGTFAAGYRYAAMGYTSCFEPAILPVNARHAHLEMGDTPMVDKGGYAMLGSDDFLLRLLAAGEEQSVVNDYVAWTLQATRCIGIKVVNPGGISAFKFNQRALDLDEPHAYYRVTPRTVVRALARAVHDLGVPHPLHVHASNLGVPGNADTTLGTMDAAEGLPIHLTHIQFHSYGTEGDRQFSSAAARIAEAVNTRGNVSCDVGQILFGQTVTASGDTMAQYKNAPHGHPRKAVIMDIECDAGCGVVPFRYRDKNFVNALQWAVGLEIFLLVSDPWRVFLTTDHPNGAPFTSYPELIRLLMDRSFRNERLALIHPDAQALTTPGSIERESSQHANAIRTRAAPPRIPGLSDRGQLGPGAAADITVYRDHPDRQRMFEAPEYVFKDGVLVARNGDLVGVAWGRFHAVAPPFDAGIEQRLARYFERYQTIRAANFAISDDEMAAFGHGAPVITHPCRGQA